MSLSSGMIFLPVRSMRSVGWWAAGKEVWQPVKSVGVETRVRAVTAARSGALEKERSRRRDHPCSMAGEQRSCMRRMRLPRVGKTWCGVGKRGAGFRGGTWNNASTNARVSDRNNAANDNANRNNNNGARCAKTSFSIARRVRAFLGRTRPLPILKGIF